MVYVPSSWVIPAPPLGRLNRGLPPASTPDTIAPAIGSYSTGAPGFLGSLGLNVTRTTLPVMTPGSGWATSNGTYDHSSRQYTPAIDVRLPPASTDPKLVW